MSSVLWNCFSVARLSTVCMYTYCFAVHVCEWDRNGNNPMVIPWEWKIRLKLVNGKEWELTA